MKKLFVLFIAALGIQLSMAQSVTLNEAIKGMSNGDKNCMSFQLEGISKKAAIADWEKYLKKYKAKAKYNKKTKEYFVDNAKLPDISSNTIDLYAKFDQPKGSKNTNVTIWFDLGGAYLSSQMHGDQYPKGEAFVVGYDRSIKKRLAEDEVKAQEKALKTLEGDLKGLEKDKKNYEKKIEDAKKTISEMEQNIKDNATKQDQKKGEIQSQKGVIETAKAKVSSFKS